MIVMSRTVYCRRCTTAYDSLAGMLPETCPACEAPALWSSEPVPVVSYVLNINDRRFLRAIRIDAE